MDSSENDEKIVLEYHFTNTVIKALDIELVTSCKCTEIKWPKNSILPGEKGIITEFYDSSIEPLGFWEKIVDFIANTNPIVVEAKFYTFIKAKK